MFELGRKILMALVAATLATSLTLVVDGAEGHAEANPYWCC